jgi:RNA polymerase sigma-70 factor, ECF subfamily
MDSMSSLSDRVFFEGEIRAILDKLYGAALRLAKNATDAEDLVAEAVTKAWTSRGSLQDPACFRGWMFRILTNTYLGERRKRGTAAVEDVPLDGPEFSLFERLHQPFLLWWSNPEQEFLNKVQREDLQRALDGLPEAYRVVLVLSELEGFSYQEVADILRVPIGTIRSRLSRARSLLQKTLWRDSEAGRAQEARIAAVGGGR